MITINKMILKLFELTIVQRNAEYQQLLILFCTGLKQAVQQPAEPKAEKATPPVEKKATEGTPEVKAPPDTVQKVASHVEVKTTPTLAVPEDKAERKADEESSLSRCIGPGCENDAQPDSVYCGNDCILRHAAAAMKSITDVKEPKQKDKAKAQKKSTLKVTWMA